LTGEIDGPSPGGGVTLFQGGVLHPYGLAGKTPGYEISY